MRKKPRIFGYLGMKESRLNILKQIIICCKLGVISKIVNLLARIGKSNMRQQIVKLRCYKNKIKNS